MKPLDQLIADPRAITQLSRDELLDRIGDCARVAALLNARLVALEAGPQASGAAADDELLTADEVARRWNLTKRFVYAHADQLGAVRVGEGTVRFSRRRLEEYARRNSQNGRTKH